MGAAQILSAFAEFPSSTDAVVATVKRASAIEYAISSSIHGESADDTIRRAEAYLDFINK